jgi:hypothetical protein
MKMAAFWDSVPSTVVEVDRRFSDGYCLYHQNNRTDDGGSNHL